MGHKMIKRILATLVFMAWSTFAFAQVTPNPNNVNGGGGGGSGGSSSSAIFNCTAAVMTLPGGGGTYAAGDLVANSATAGSVVPLSCVAVTSGKNVIVTGATLTTSNTTITNGSFNIELYTSLPTVTNGNDGAFLSTMSGHFCTLPTSLLFVGSDGAQGRGAPAVTTSCNRVLSGTQTIYALISVQAAYAWTAAQTFTLQIEGFN